MNKHNRFSIIKSKTISSSTSNSISNASSAATHQEKSNYSLTRLGWRPFFAQQVAEENITEIQFAKVMACHRNQFELETSTHTLTLPITNQMPDITVGDWLVLNDDHSFRHRLERISLFSRKAPGSKVQTQLIAANVDTVFIVSSLNNDFNLNRIERYLALANEARVTPVFVLTKADLCDDTRVYIKQILGISPLAMIETVNALARESVQSLHTYCSAGQTVAVMGSSGVGKSTLINSLIGSQSQLTSDIREDDSKGRHTTTGRTLHQLKSGGLLLDTPGMRELQLADCEQGVADTFEEIISLARQCRFGDCHHQSEPGCAVQMALTNGELESRRLTSYLKLLREQALNTASLAQKRAKDRNRTKFHRSVQDGARRLKGK
ncbi:ribosome small subunit-dependent GTPase A [Shewanella sp. YLB-07]|uniref:ribosome small subunit-dependent GTPase A n=1 Tax=Shewanella sp. YLB-07 TaxID=2601268 RepID=UPI00128BAEED|nr:ribosome small subunit-dependent GTPase A [Shewanella sp. YLB-07]MPY22434.1 ribosome small subunit-dependent GTPase A [Shewanella sp. YLB-07]